MWRVQDVIRRLNEAKTDADKNRELNLLKLHFNRYVMQRSKGQSPFDVHFNRASPSEKASIFLDEAAKVGDVEPGTKKTLKTMTFDPKSKRFQSPGRSSSLPGKPTAYEQFIQPGGEKRMLARKQAAEYVEDKPKTPPPQEQEPPIYTGPSLIDILKRTFSAGPSAAERVADWKKKQTQE